MRGDPDDPDLWGGLYDRFRREDMPPRDPGGRPWWSYGVGGRGRGRMTSLPPESKVRLIDAALGIVSSIRTFTEVAEDVLIEQRDRMGDTPHEPRYDERFTADPAPRSDSHVQDIPMEDA